MAFEIARRSLNAAVANGGTFDVRYPAGRVASDFDANGAHVLGSMRYGRLTPPEVQFSFGTDILTITNNSGTTFDQLTAFNVQLELFDPQDNSNGGTTTDPEALKKAELLQALANLAASSNARALAAVFVKALSTLDGDDRLSMSLLQPPAGQRLVTVPRDEDAVVGTLFGMLLNELTGDLAKAKFSGGPEIQIAAESFVSISPDGSRAFYPVSGIGGGTAASTTDVLTGTSTTTQATPDSIAALWEQGSNIASAATISIGEGGYFHVTGTTTITDIDFATDKTGRTVRLVFDGALTLTHNASTLILPGGVSITTAAGDSCTVVSEGSDVVRVLNYTTAAVPVSDAFVAVSDAATVTMNLAAGRNFKVTLGASRILDFSNYATRIGQSGIVEVYQDGTGGWGLTISNTDVLASPANGGVVVLNAGASEWTALAYYVDTLGKVKVL